MKLVDIEQQNLVKPLDYLKKDQELCREIQTRLQVLGLLPPNGVDGLYGPQTQEAFEQFKQRIYKGLGAGSAKLLLEIKELPGGDNVISKTQVDNRNSISLQDIVQQNIVKPLDYLKQDRELCREIQTRLQVLGLLPPNGVDGLYGPQTKEAFEQFKQRTHEKELDTLGAGTAKLLLKLKKLPGGGNLISKTQAEYIYGNHSISDEQLADLNSCLNRFEINTHPRMRHFLSQTAEESVGLKDMEEQNSGDQYQGRKDLGNTHPGDGRKYKGVGVLQLTGRYNYQALANYLNDSNVMAGYKYVMSKYPFTSGGFWWYDHNMNALCDHGATVKEVTKRVNRGYNGLAQREAYYEKALKVFPK